MMTIDGCCRVLPGPEQVKIVQDNPLQLRVFPYRHRCRMARESLMIRFPVFDFTCTIELFEKE